MDWTIGLDFGVSLNTGLDSLLECGTGTWDWFIDLECGTGV